jgi:hypothetical protein
MSEDWRFGRQASDNEHTLYIELFPDTKLASGKEQDASKLEPVLLSKILTLKIHRD